MRLIGLCLLAVSVTMLRALPAAAQVEKPPTLGLVTVTAGVGFSRPNSWGLIDATVTNPADREVEYLLCAFPPARPETQCCKRIWLPAHSRRLEWLPVRAGEIPSRALTVPLTAFLLDQRVQPERRVLAARGELFPFTGTLAVGVLSGPNERVVSDAIDGLLKLAGLEKRLVYLADESLPAFAPAWQALDCLVIARPRPALDAAQRSALRQWLAAGGRVWIMLDQVDPAFAAGLLGDDWHVAAVDRVGLTDLTIRKGAERLHLTADAPVPMLRVLPGGAEVTHTINGWPAVMRLAAGRGAVLLTTVELRDPLTAEIDGGRDMAAFLVQDFLRPATPSPMSLMPVKEAPPVPAVPAPPKKLRPGAPVPPPRATPLTPADVTPPKPPPVPAEAIKKLAGVRIGDQVLGRGFVAAVLGLFCAAMLAAGWFLHRTGRSGHLAWVGAALAVVGAAVLVVPAMRLRAATPRTASVAAYAEVDAGQGTASLAGTLALYSPQAATVDLKVRGGTLWPDRSTQTGKTQRLVFSDLDTCAWQAAQLPAGGRCGVEFTARVPMAHPPTGSARFGPEGLAGTIAAEGWDDLGDLLLTTPAGRLAPRLSGGQSGGKSRGQSGGGGASGSRAFVAGPGDWLPADQYVGHGSMGLISDEQRWHGDVYRALLARPQASNEPTLYAWTALLDPGLAVPGATRRLSATVLSLPLTIERTAPGTAVVVPSAFVPFRIDRTVAAPGDNAPGAGRPLILTAYDAINRVWIETTLDGTMVLVFQPPPQVMPLRLNSARFTLDIDAPGRSVAILVGGGLGRVVSEQNSPAGEMTVELAEPGGVAFGGSDEIRLLVRISPAGQPQDAPKWRVRRVGLELSGVTE